MIVASLILVQCHSRSSILPVADLVVDPITWNGKQVTISGYAVVTGGYEEPALIWASKEEASKSEFAPSVSVTTLSEKYSKKDWRSPYKGRVRVWGTFRSVDYDPLHKLHLEEITRIDWVD